MTDIFLNQFFKVKTAHRKYTFTIKHNMRNRTKKDGVGTFADIGNDLNKRAKYYYEFAARDFALAITKHTEHYGTHLSEQQWIGKA